MHLLRSRPPHLTWRAGLCVLVVALISFVVLVVPGRAQHPALGAQGVAPSGQWMAWPAEPVSSALVGRAARGDRVVALTFDDGPHPEYTPQVLALLARYDAVATFCMVGTEVARHPELVHEVAAAGMRLCAHTTTHDKDLVIRSEPQIEQEIVGSRDDMLTAADAVTTVDYFRAPYGKWSEPIQRIAAQHGMTSLAWSVDPRDWSRPGAAQIVAEVQHHVEPGSVILLHDGGGPRDQTVAALEELLPWLVEQGYQFDVPG